MTLKLRLKIKTLPEIGERAVILLRKYKPEFIIYPNKPDITRLLT